MAEAPPPDGVLRGHAAEVMTVRFAAGNSWCQASSPSHPLLLSGDANGEVRLWSLETRRPLATLSAHPDKSVLSVQALADGVVLSQGRDGHVRLWDAKDGGAMRGPLLQVPSQSYNFCQCACSPSLYAQGRTVCNGSDSQVAGAPTQDAHLIDGAPLATPDGGTAPSASGPTAAVLAMASEDATFVQLWDPRQKTAVHSLMPSAAAGRAGMCMCARFAGSDQVLLTGWEDGSLQLFDLRAGAAVASRRVHSEPLLCLDVDASASHVITGGADRTICVLPLQTSGGDLMAPTGKIELPPSDETAGSGGVASLAMRPDGRIFAAGGWDRRVRVWQWRKLKPLAVLQQHTATVHAVTYSACSRWLASAAGDKTIALWQLFPPHRSSETTR